MKRETPVSGGGGEVGLSLLNGVPRVEVVDTHNRVPPGQQRINEMGADETGGSGYNHVPRGA